jgi:putative phosphoribosyl transferase
MRYALSYVNRTDAGEKLIPLLKNKINKETVLFTIPRGGVIVAKPIATRFHFPIHLLMIKKISHPENEELAIGACGLTEYILEQNYILSKNDLYNRLQKLRANLALRQTQLSYSLPLSDLSGKTVLLIDDGAATGLTLLCGVRELKKMHPERIILAIPVASYDAEKLLRREVDEFICPVINTQLQSVGQYYHDFSQVSDVEVRKMVKPEKIQSESESESERRKK